MLFDPAVVQKTFAKAAHTYDEAAVLHREIADRLMEHLDLVRLKPQMVLELGARNGYVTGLLSQRYPYAEITSFPHPPSGHLLPEGEGIYDLIVSNLMLPWCNDVEAIFKEAHRVLKPNGLFLFSTFGPDTLGELRASWAKVDEMPHVHLFYDLHDVGDALLRSGFADPVMQTEWLTMIYENPQSLFKDLKNTGSVNILLERRKTLTGKKRFEGCLAEYETYRDAAGKLPATFEMVYGHCWKVEKNKEVVIPVSAIKYPSPLGGEGFM